MINATRFLLFVLSFLTILGISLVGAKKTIYIDGVEVQSECSPTPAPVACPWTAMDFSMLNRGEYVGDQLWHTYGIKISAKANSGGFTPGSDGRHDSNGGKARVFDSAFPNGLNGECPGNKGDPDLGSPNKHCPGGGPGVGSGGKPNSQFANCDPLGNLIIIQESDKACADDSKKGGVITFEFKDPAEIDSVTLLDNDEKKTPTRIYTYSGETNFEEAFTTVVTGNNGVYTQTINRVSVNRLTVSFRGSGSVAEMKYKACP